VDQTLSAASTDRAVMEECFPAGLMTINTVPGPQGWGPATSLSKTLKRVSLLLLPGFLTTGFGTVLAGVNLKQN